MAGHHCQREAGQTQTGPGCCPADCPLPGKPGSVTSRLARCSPQIQKGKDMLQIDKVQQIEGVTVYGDDTAFEVFYLLPQKPRYRLNPDGTPAFRFLKYRFPVDRQDGKRGGGYLLFDAEFVVPEDTMPKIMETLTAQV